MFGEMGEDDHQTMHGVRGVRLSDVLLIRGLGKWKLKTMKTINFDSGFCESRKGDGGHLSSLTFYCAREQITPIPFVLLRWRRPCRPVRSKACARLGAK